MLVARRNEVVGDAIQATGLLLMLISSGRLPFAIAYYKTEKVTASQDGGIVKIRDKLSLIEKSGTQ